jgi:hypothetical protein
MLEPFPVSSLRQDGRKMAARRIASTARIIKMIIPVIRAMTRLVDILVIASATRLRQSTDLFENGVVESVEEFSGNFYIEQNRRKCNRSIFIIKKMIHSMH